MSSINNLEKLVKLFCNNINYYKSPKYNESACRLEFIDTLLKILGWDVNNESGKAPQYREVFVEDYYKETGRPDYSMTLNGISKFFIEVKKPYTNIIIDRDCAFQARSYGWSAKHKIVVLTNFEFLLIYDATIMPQYNDNTNVALLKKYHYTEYIEKFEEIYNIISKESVYNGKFEKNFKKIETLKQQIDEVFLEQINEWRVRLGEYLLNKGFTLDIINDSIQDFINQIIFLRICEDRNLPTYRKLIETIQDEKQIKKELYSLFVQADKRYNSGLFKGEYLIFDLNNSIIKDIIETLYYPKSPYIFKLIESSLLGQIYEMFLVKHLIINTYGKIVLEEKKHNKNRSVVTTPIEIVKYMVEKSLKPLCDGKTPIEIKKLKIADISCGSGVFLIESLDYLFNYCIEWYKNNNNTNLIEIGNCKYKLPLREKKEILLSCIYGIDIDPHATEVAKFSLLLKLLEDENEPTVEPEKPILPDLSNNVLTGNSLIDYDLVKKYKAEDEISEIIPFNWDTINDGKPFDLIIGNPPYVKTEDMKNQLSNKEVLIYKKNYKSAFKQFDKYFLFIERAVENLKKEGILCFIIPNKFTKIVSGEKLRQLLTDNNYVKEYIDFGSQQLFEDKTVYSSILILKKKENETFLFREVQDITKWWLSKDTSEKSLRLNSSLITHKPWVLVADIELMEKINKLYTESVPLKEIAHTFNGIQTSAERPPVYWFARNEIISETKEYFEIFKFGKKYVIEKSILKPFFKPIKRQEKNLYTYDILQTNKWIIFPYDAEGNLFDVNTMEKFYPNTMRYLKDRFDMLKPKQLSFDGKGRDIPRATNDTWYQYGRHQSFKEFHGTRKLIVGVMSKKPMYMYDKNNFVIASGGTAGYCAIKEKEKSPYSLEYIQAYLTHPLIEKIISVIGSDFEGNFYSRGTSVLDVIPVKKLDFTNEKDKRLHDNIVKKARQIYQINDNLVNKISKKEQIVLESRKRQLIFEIMSTLDEILNWRG